MHHPEYEQIVQFASEGELADELSTARKEYVTRTGDMFENDSSFERRLASFLEWYVLDRPVSSSAHLTPAKIYIKDVTEARTTPEITELRALTKTRLSLFEFKSFKKDNLKVLDLLTNQKLQVFERRKPTGLESGDIIEARLVPKGDTHMFSETFGFHPREARKPILKAAKLFRKEKINGDEESPARLDLIHRVAFLANRCERYGHLPPTEIFSELV